MNGKSLWRMDEARKEEKRQKKLTLPSAATVLEVLWGEALEKDPGLPEKMGANLVGAINDVVACA